jgi:hypothetical protein
MRRSGPWLLAAAILCVAAAYAVDRFGYELCHRGLPLGLLAVCTPIAGALAGLAALWGRPRTWVMAIASAAVAANVYYLAMAMDVLANAGFLACG